MSEELIAKLRAPLMLHANPEQTNAERSEAANVIERLTAALSETTAERDAARTALEASIRIAGTARARAIYEAIRASPKQPGAT